MQEDEREGVGVIGLGIIGSRVAAVLRNAGEQVYVWNRSPRSEPNFVASPGELARLANRIQIFVTGGDDLLKVVRALAPELTRRHVVISNCTADPRSVVEAYQIVTDAGARFLDAPFTGSRDAASEGNLLYYIGGDPKVLDEVRSVLELSSRKIVPIGRVGEASVIKIATNMISAATMEILGEAYGLVRSAGIEPERLKEAIQDNACGSPLAAMKLPSVARGDFEPHFSLENMFKDAQYALALAKELGVELPALSTTANVMYRTMKAGHGKQDFSVVAARYGESPN